MNIHRRVTSPTELRVVVIEIRVDDGITGDSVPRWDWPPLRFCLPLTFLYVCRFVTQSFLCGAEILGPSPTFWFLHFFSHFLPLALFFSSSVILLAIFSATFFSFETLPSHRAVWYCSNCFLQLHWPNKRKWPLMLIAHKRHWAFPSRDPTSDYFIVLYQTVMSYLCVL